METKDQLKKIQLQCRKPYRYKRYFFRDLHVESLKLQNLQLPSEKEPGLLQNMELLIFYFFLGGGGV